MMIRDSGLLFGPPRGDFGGGDIILCNTEYLGLIWNSVSVVGCARKCLNRFVFTLLKLHLSCDVTS